MSNENILQAPAQGFGQDVTFSARIDPRATPFADGASRRGQSRGGVQGAPTNTAGPRMTAIEAPPPNPTMALLSRVAGEYLGNRIRQERAAAFVTGMQKAAAGEAIKDISEGQPWYAQIFGDSDVVEGARAYTAQAKAAEVAGTIEDSMAEVRKLGPEEANKYFSEIVAKTMTGDDITDASLMQGFARTLPGTMRRHAKEHYAWRQEQASEAESRALLSAADLLQKRAGSDKQTDDEYATQAVQLIANMRPAEGRDVHSWVKARTQDLLSLAQAGKFHAVNAIRSAGMLDLLPPENRTKVESALDSAENRTLANKSFEYADDIAAIAGQAEVYSTDLSPEGTTARLRDLNQRFRRETGIDRDIISLDKAGGIIKDAHVTLLREGERRLRKAEEDAKAASTEADKERAKLILETGADQLISLGQAGAGRESEKLRGVIDDRFKRAYDSLRAKGPEAQAQLLALNYNAAGNGTNLYINKDLKDRFERRVEASIGAQMPAEFLQLHAEYAALRDKHPALADAYFGKHADRMALYDELLTGTGRDQPGSRGEAQAFVAAFGSQTPPRAKTPDEKGRKAIRAALAEQHDAPDWKFWKQQRVPLRKDQLDYASHDLEQDVSRFLALPGVSTEQAVRRAWAANQRDKGSDMLGGFYVKGAAGQAPLTSILAARRPQDGAAGTGSDAPDVWDEAFKGTLIKRAEEIGASMSDPVTIYRVPDKDGVAWMHVLFTGKDGRQVPVVVSSNDIKQHAYRAAAQAAEAKKTQLKPSSPSSYFGGIIMR